ncbi:MAG TPA: hypothetical protein VJT31_22680, partial [Rugosimonospora sp.]|nr:hypothetical protein [Rugosimonospora sp.]
ERADEDTAAARAGTALVAGARSRRSRGRGRDAAPLAEEAAEVAGGAALVEDEEMPDRELVEDLVDEDAGFAGADLADEDDDEDDLLDSIEEDEAEEGGENGDFEPIDATDDNGHFRASADDPDAIEGESNGTGGSFASGAAVSGRRRVVWASRRRSRP